MGDFSSLKHVTRLVPGGGKVTVLDTGALIGAEEEAMLQALHSRSLGGIDAHLIKLAQKGAAQFMQTHYVGYGDKSIGDCGTTTVFIENVSMLAAKAIQDSQLYNGQEASTRYIDFAKQPFINPDGSIESAKLLDSLRRLHLKGLAYMRDWTAARHPLREGQEETEWKKAVNARAFDVMRGFLPAGAATNLAWHTELRHAADHLLRLRNHPLSEVRRVARAIREALSDKHPNSFNQKRYDATEAYADAWMKNHYYFDGPQCPGDSIDGVVLEHDGIDLQLLRSYRDILENRPIKAEPPKFLAETGTLRLSCLLDFGSFRDLQRQRALVQRMPLLTTNHGFGPWYFDQMPSELRAIAEEHLPTYVDGLKYLSLDPAEMQYLTPLGYQVPCRMSGDLPAYIWMVELRTGIHVHPTLRRVAHGAAKHLLSKYGQYGLKLFLDDTEDRFSYGRGKHDIVERPAAG